MPLIHEDPMNPPGPETVAMLETAHGVIARLRARIAAQVIGRDDVIELVVAALLADGHVLLEDYPGSGKTTLAKALGAAIEEGDADKFAAFRRIQFTPDLLPSDITGVSVFDARTSAFQFRPGPLFAHIVLADEINRTSPKVQSAMLEAMAEKQVTVDNVTYPLDELFFVIATQNPRDVAGTYPLPVPQLDRFLFKIRMKHIARAEELEVLHTRRARRDLVRADLPLVTREEVLATRRTLDTTVKVHASILECLVDISRTLRADDRVRQGNSTRSLVLAVPALQAYALGRRRDFVSAQDIEDLVPHILAHRIEAAIGATAAEEVVRECMVGALENLTRRTLGR
jgi:MoxR-like ATPase